MPEPNNVAAAIRREQDGLAAETRIGNCPPLVAVNNLDDVARVPSSLRFAHPASVSPLPGAKGAAFVVECASLDSRGLWVGTDNDRYRKDYISFLNATYGLELSAIPAPYDVDHLYNRTRARAYGFRFIRLALVGQGANRSHGGSYEKDITKNEAGRVPPDMRLMDEITSMKYFGFLSPLRDDPREAEVSAYANFAASKLGLNASEVRARISYLRTKASTPWARKE